MNTSRIYDFRNSENSHTEIAGHVMRMPEIKTASIALNWLSDTGRRSRVDLGRQDD